MENKPTVEELLRQQLELLAERSANEASVEQLPQLTLAMVEVYKNLPNKREINFNKPTTSELDSIIKEIGERMERAFVEAAHQVSDENEKKL